MFIAVIFIGLIVVVSSIRKPLIGLYAMLVALQMENFFLGVLPSWLTLGRLAGLCAMAGWLVNRHKYRSTPLLSSASLAAPGLLFFAVAIFGALLALDMPSAFSETIRVSMLLLLGIIVSETIQTRRDLLTLFWVIVLSTAVGAVAALMQFDAYQGGGDVAGVYQSRGGVRFEGLSGNANVLGIHLLTSIPFLFCLFYVSRRIWIRIACLGLMGVTAFAMVLSVSRSNLFPLGIYIAATNLLHRKLGKHLVADNAMIAIAAGMLCLAVVQSSEFVWMRISRPIVDQEDETSGHTRLAILLQGPKVMSISPIFGVGLRNTRQYLMHLEAHDTISALLGETGLFGTLLFVAFCGAILRRQKSLLARARMSGDPLLLELAVALVGIVCVLIAWIPVKVIYYQRLFWLWAGLVVWLDVRLRAPPGAIAYPRAIAPSPGWPAPPPTVPAVPPWGGAAQPSPQGGSGHV